MRSRIIPSVSERRERRVDTIEGEVRGVTVRWDQVLVAGHVVEMTEFHPDKPPVAGLLARWLAKHAAEWSWLAAAVDRANEKLSDRQAAIGPSYFMKRNLDDEMVRLIWEHNVLPYVEEHLYGEHERLREFDLDALRKELGDGANQDGDAPPADDGPSDETD